MIQNDHTRMLSHELTPAMVDSMRTPVPDFVPKISIPSQLGHAAHERLEELLGRPIATDDRAPTAGDALTGQRPGEALGDFVGREKEFTRNLPIITANMQQVAEANNVTEAELWSELLTILTGSGIGNAMHRTLNRPLDGSYGAQSYIDEHAKNGITFIVRNNIANWGARRHDRLVATLGGLSNKAIENVLHVIYAGSARQYSGPELWRPDVRPYVVTDQDGKESCTLTEASAASTLYLPQTERILQNQGMAHVQTHAVALDNPKASGDQVVEAIAAAHGDAIKGTLIVEIGNAPAGYTQLAGALVLARLLGINPSEQFVAITDSVELVSPSWFSGLDPEARSKVQNVATALNSLNGWLQTIVNVNRFYSKAENDS